MGIFGRNIEAAYGTPATELLTRPASAPLSISSPWSPQDTLLTLTADALGAAFPDPELMPLTQDIALRVPGVDRAHLVTCGMLADIPFFEMDGDTRTTDQPKWLTNSASGVAPYHRMFGAATDWFFHGWACFGFTSDMGDCLHIPFGLWKCNEHGVIEIDEHVPAEYTANPIAVPLGYGQNGLLVNGADTIRQARKIEAAYQARLENPVPLTVLTLDGDKWDSSKREEREELRDEWDEGRRKYSTAMKPSWIDVDMPGQIAVDLYETGRNGARLDIANHTHVPASLIEGVRQGGGGGGTEMRYQGVANGAERGDLWEYGQAKRMLAAFEARMSLDDVCAPGLSIRGDLTAMQSVPAPNTNPTSED